MAKRKVDKKTVDPLRCFECGEAAYLDHYVVPKALGGKVSVPLCYNCYLKAHSVGGNRVEYIDNQAIESFTASRSGRKVQTTSIGHPLSLLFYLYTLQFEAREGSLRRCQAEKFQKLADELNALGLPTQSGTPYTATICRDLYAQIVAKSFRD